MNESTVLRSIIPEKLHERQQQSQHDRMIQSQNKSR